MLPGFCLTRTGAGCLPLIHLCSRLPEIEGSLKPERGSSQLVSPFLICSPDSLFRSEETELNRLFPAFCAAQTDDLAIHPGRSAVKFKQSRGGVWRDFSQ